MLHDPVRATAVQRPDDEHGLHGVVGVLNLIVLSFSLLGTPRLVRVAPDRAAEASGKHQGHALVVCL